MSGTSAIAPGLQRGPARRAGWAVEAIEDAPALRSGMPGPAGASDLREAHRRIAAGDADAALALGAHRRRIREVVGACLAVLGRADVVVLTATAGEHDAGVRARSPTGLDGLGIGLDAGRDAAPGDGTRVVPADASPVAVLGVPTDEELELARGAAAPLEAG